MIKDGATVAKFLEKNRFYDAVVAHIKVNTLATKDVKFLQDAFNSSSDDFWAIIKNDKALAKKIKHHDND